MILLFEQCCELNERKKVALAGKKLKKSSRNAVGNAVSLNILILDTNGFVSWERKYWERSRQGGEVVNNSFYGSKFEEFQEVRRVSGHFAINNNLVLVLTERSQLHVVLKNKGSWHNARIRRACVLARS